jgi:hypothetical protein
MKRKSGLFEGLQGMLSTAFGGGSVSNQGEDEFDLKYDDSTLERKSKSSFERSRPQKQPTAKEIDQMNYNDPDFKVKEEEIETTRTLKNQIPSLYIKPEKEKAQRIVILKIFEEDLNYSKIIPRTISFITQKRLQTFECQKNFVVSEVEVALVLDLIKQDDPWLEEISPIRKIQIFDSETKRLKVLEKEDVLKITEKQETSFSIFVKRTNGYQGEDEVKVFDSFKDATTFVKKFSKNPDSNGCRYYDLYHHGYTLIDSDVKFPVYRAGTSLVKILIQKKKIFQKKSVSVWKDIQEITETVVIEESRFSIEYDKKQSMLEVYEFSENIDPKKIPLKDHECTLESEKVRVVAWKKLKTLPKTRDELNKIKSYTELGIPPKLRKTIYFVATDSVPDLKVYESLCKKLFEAYRGVDVNLKEVDPKIYPTFGAQFTPEHFFLSEEGVKAAKRIFCVLAFNNPELEYSPRIVHTCCLLLSVMEEFECYEVLQNMIKISKKNDFYMRFNLYESLIHFYSFDKLIEKYLPKIVAHMKTLQFDFENLHKKWYNEFSHDMLPYRNLLRLFDRYMVGGLNELCVYAYSVLKANEKELLQFKTKEEIANFMKNRTPSETDAFKYRITFDSKAFQNQVKPVVDKMTLNAKFDKYTRPQILTPSTVILHPNQWEYLCYNLPYGKRLRKLDLLYTTSKDGYNLGNIYHATKEIGPLVLILQVTPVDLQNDIKCLDNFVIGVYCGEEFCPSNNYEGTTDTMVFSLKPKYSAYKWTKKNDYFSLGKENSLSFGGGG